MNATNPYDMGESNPAQSGIAKPAANYFKSPSTGNAVTWDSTGKQTDTGIPHDVYDKSQQGNPTTGIIDSAINKANSWGGGQTQAEANAQAAASATTKALTTAATGNNATQPKAPMTAAQNSAIYGAWSKYATPSAENAQTLVDSMNQNNVGIGDVQNTFNHGNGDNGGYSNTAAQDYFTAHGYGADPATGKLVKGATNNQAASPAQNTPSATPGVSQTPAANGSAISPGAGNAGGIISNAMTNAQSYRAPTTPVDSGNMQGPSSVAVNPNMLVSNNVKDLVKADSPLMQQARTSALERMNDRGLANSSMAVTAGADAAYRAALPIAQADANTNYDAAKTNNSSTNQFATASNSQARDLQKMGAQHGFNMDQIGEQGRINKDLNAQNIGAQRELQHSTQLFQNLNSQTASANSIQSWGLNTITTIQASDLSAEAKNAAINSVKQYLASSYQIQGDWHKSAAQAIDAIFK